MTDNFSDFEIIISNFEPSLATSNPLASYLTKWEEKIRPASSNPEADVEAFRDSLDRQFLRMGNFLASDELVFQGLALGDAQAGKTGHMTATACWCVTQAVDLLVVLSGTKLSLTNQTRKRLEKEIPAGVASIHTVAPSYSPSDLNSLIADLRPRVAQRLMRVPAPLPILVATKNTPRLSTLVEIVVALRKSLPADTPLNVVVIDDEGDEASADTTARSRGRGARRNRAPIARNARAVHSRILELRSHATGKLIYLSYTATPQALFLGEIDGALQPQFVTIVPSGSSYFGLQTAVSDPNVFETIPLSGVATQGSPQADIFAALEHAIAEFLFQAWLHALHRDFFHSGLASAPVCNSTGIQMLVHPSAAQADHKLYCDYINQLLQDWSRQFVDPGQRGKLIKTYFLPAFVSGLARFPEELQRACGLGEPSLIEFLQFAFELLSGSQMLQVLETNSSAFQQRMRTQSGGEALPSDDEGWQGPHAWILVGGNILGRGITIPHLTTSFFLRDPQSPNLDTVTQQMRFCGYRRSYARSIKIYAPPTLLTTYSDIAEIDGPFRLRAEEWDRDSVDLRKRHPIARFVVPNTSRLRLTRSNVVSGDVSGLDTSQTNNSGVFSTRHTASPARFLQNLSIVRSFTSRDSLITTIPLARQGYSVEAFESSSEAFRGLLRDWSVADSDSAGINVLRELLQWESQSGGLLGRRCVLLVDSNLLGDETPVSLVDLTQTSSSNWLTRTAETPRSYSFSLNQQRMASPSAADDSVRIPTVVGDTERSPRMEFADAVVLHVRAYELRTHQNSNPFTRGISLIGWIPDDSSVYTLNLEAAWRYDD